MKTSLRSINSSKSSSVCSFKKSFLVSVIQWQLKLFFLMQLYLSVLNTVNFFKIYSIKIRKGYKLKSLIAFVLFLGGSLSAIAQPSVTTQPSNFSTVCQPNSPTLYTQNQPFDVGNGSCSNSGGIFTFVWQYNSGTSASPSWGTIQNGTPSGFITYTVTSTSASNGKSGTSQLSVTLNSTATTGTFEYRCIASQSNCSVGNTLPSSTITFTVNAKPTPTFTQQPGASTCVNNIVTYTTQAGQTGYTWAIPGIPGTDYTVTSMSPGATLATSNLINLKWLIANPSRIVTINYTNSNGCVAASATSSNATAVSGPPTPTFITQPSGTVCSSTDVTYTTQSGGGESNYIWSIPGILGTDYTITSGGTGTGSNTVTLQWLTSGSKVVTINYSNSNGCSAASATSSNSVSVTARPVPSFVSPPSGNICSITDVTYTTQTGGGLSNYIWSFPASTLGTDYTITSGSSSSTSSTITLKWLTTGSKIVTVNYTSSVCAGLTAASSTVNVNLRPAVSFTSSPGTNSCASTDVIYTTQAGQSNYMWTVEGILGTDYSISSGSVATTSNTVTIKWLTTGANRTVTVNYTNSNSCTALTAATSTTFINSRPSPTFTSRPNVTTCANTEVTYATQSGQSAYVWNVPGTAGVDYLISSGGIGSSNNTVTLQWLTSGSKTVTVNYNNASGCNALTSVSSTTTVNIPATPTVTSGTSTTFCSGGSVTLKSSSGSSYQWYKNGTIITGTTLISYTANTAGTYTVTVTNASGCTATSAGTTVTINSLPFITTLAQATSTCFSSSTQISKLSYSTVTNSPTTYSITWNSAATSTGFATVTNAALPASPINITVPASAPVNSYVGTITVTNANGCTSPSNSFTLDVTAAPNVSNFSVASANSCINSGATITINSSTLANGTYTVSYDLSGSNTATGNTASMIFTAGTGTFITSALSNLGLTNITATQVASVGCNAVPAANTASFTVNSLPVINSSTGPNNVCIGNTITLTNSTGGGGWSSSNTAIATVNSSGIVIGVTAGSVNIIYTTAPNGNNCTNSFSSPITVNALPAISLITGTTTLCMGTITNLNNATAGGTWSSSNTSVATVDNTGLVTASTTTSGTSIITYTVPADGNGCSNSTTASVTVDPVATVNAGNATAITVCQSATPVAITLTGATVGGGATTGAWSIVSGGGSLSTTAQTATPATVTYTPAANFSGTVTLLLTTNQPGSCPAVTATRTITVSQAPTVSAGANNTVCQSSSPTPITLSGTSLGGGAATAAWSITLGTGTLSSVLQTSTPDAVTFTPTANFSGPVTLTLTTNTSGACAAAIATRTVNITAIPTVNAGGPDTKCQGASAITLSGASFGGGASSAAWSITSSGGGTLSSIAQTASPATVTYTPLGTFNGTITLTLTSDALGGCSAVNTTRTININAPATSTAGTAVSTCSNSGAVNITAGSSTSNSSGVSWTSSGTGTFANANSLTTATYTPSAADISAGSVTLTLTAAGNISCGNVISTKTLTITAGPTANAGTAIITCSDATQTSSGSSAVSITAGASASNYTSLLWSSSGTGTFTDPTSLTTATYTPSAADKSAGSVTLTLKAFGSGLCGNVTSTKTLTITPAIDPTTSNNWTQVATCSGSGVQFVLPAPPSGGNGTFSYQWMNKNNCGVAGTSTPIPGATGLTFLPTDLSACYWLFISSGGCAVPQNLVSTTTRQNPSATIIASSNVTFSTGSTTNLCIGSSIPLTATSAVSYTYAWSPPTGLSATTGSTVTANPTTTTTYTVTATATDGSGCQKSAAVTVTVRSLPTASISGTVSACQNATAPLITFTGTNGTAPYIFSYNINGGATQTVTSPAGANPVSVTVPASTTAVGTFTYNLQSVQGVYCSQLQTGTATITVNVLPTISGTLNVCIGSTTPLSGSATADGTTPWVSSTPSVATISNTGVVTGVAAGTSVITYKNSNGCTITATVTVNPLPTVTVSSSNICGGAAATITATPSIAGTYSYAWTVPGTATNPGSVATFTTLVTGSYSVVITNSNGCVSVSSATTSTTISAVSNSWTGAVSTNWSDFHNWSCGAIPTTVTDVIIPSGVTNMPQLTATSVTKSLLLQPNTFIDLNGHDFTNYGAVTGTGIFKGSAASNLTINAPAAVSSINFDQTTDGGTNALNNLTINGSGASVTLTNKADLYGTLTPTAGTLTINDTLVLRSTSTGTARVAEVTGAIAYGAGGKVTVERYYPARRAWRLVTAPLAGAGSIFSTWQNGGVYPPTGKGTYVSGPGANPATNGMDVSPLNNTSLKIGSLLAPITNTLTTNLSNATSVLGLPANKGYFIFVRGDRDYNNTNIANSNNTTLSSSGKLQTGDQQFNLAATEPEFLLIGNPYASPVDFNKLYKSNLGNNFGNIFYVWDPFLNIQQGGYIAMLGNDTTDVYISSAPTTQTKSIQSSQAFFIRKETPGYATIVNFTEPLKSTDTKAGLFRPMNQMVSLRTNLYLRMDNGTTVLADGNFARFDDQFSAGVDRQDALKFGNVYETMGILSGNTSLAISSRPLLTKADTIFFKFTRARQLKYQFEFIADNIEQENLAGFVEDKFLNKATPLNINTSTKLDFEVTADAASAAADRFKIVFKPSVVYTSLTATVLNSDIGVEWNVANELNIKEYDIERSVNGISFTKVATKGSSGDSTTSVSYNWLDVSPALGYYYYRIRSISNNNVIGYSNVVKVKINRSTPAMYVFPNPVTENIIHLQMNSMPKGVYAVRLTNTLGQVIGTNPIGHLEGTATETIQPNNKLLTGIYQLEITTPNKKTSIIKVIVK